MPSVECPRCGYDLRGSVAMWTDACPVEGRCVECGCDFQWGLLLTPDAMPPWFLERPRGRSFRGLRTLAHSIMPWRFWRDIRMTMPVRGVLWTYPLRLLVFLLLMSAVANAARTLLTLPTRPMPDRAADAIAVAGALLIPWSRYETDIFAEWLKPGWAARTTPWPHMRKLGSIQGVPYYSRTLCQPPYRTWRGVCGTALRAVVPGLAAAVAATAMFVCLPIVRRRAKVRWAHVHRAGVYSLGLLALAAIAVWALDLASMNAATSRPRFGYGGEGFIRMPTWEMRLFPFVLFWWWWCAAALYMKVERPVSVALAVTVVGTITGFIVSLLLAPVPSLWLIPFVA